MDRFVQFIKDVFYAILRTFAVSAILFIISWSLITHEFPPKIDKMVKGITRMKEMMALTQELAAEKLKKDQDPDSKISNEKMQALQSKWAKLTTEILPAPDKPTDVSQETMELRIQRLEAQIKNLQTQIDLMHAGM